MYIFLQLCVILEPMQELMSRHKAYALSPRDCLKTTLFQKWQRMVAPPGELFYLLKIQFRNKKPIIRNGLLIKLFAFLVAKSESITIKITNFRKYVI